MRICPFRRATGPIRRAKGGWTAQEVSIFHSSLKSYDFWSRSFSCVPVCQLAYESVRLIKGSCLVILCGNTLPGVWFRNYWFTINVISSIHVDLEDL